MNREPRKSSGRSKTFLWIIALVSWFAFTSLDFSWWHHSVAPHHGAAGSHNASFESFYWQNGSLQPSPESVWQLPLSTKGANLLVLPNGYEVRSIAPHVYRDNTNSIADDGLNWSADGRNMVDADSSKESREDGDVKGDEVDQIIGMEDRNSQIRHIKTESQVGDPPKNCASVEEMGLAAVGNVNAASLRVRRLILDYFAEHGADSVRKLPAEKFCQRGFVYGRATEDGLGNDIYKILTAAGLSVMLNRSLIIGEHGSTNPAYFGLTGRVRLPFGDYLKYSNQSFSMSEVKRLWVKHECAGTFHRSLTMIIDDFQRLSQTKVLCEDWTKWQYPIIWFKGTTDSNALQFFLKNRHSMMRLSASLLFGDPSEPSSRSNVFGELLNAFISPMPVIEEAVEWALQGGPDPDVSVHMRMLNSRSVRASSAVCRCIQRVVRKSRHNQTLPQVVVVSDTPIVIRWIKAHLEGLAKVVHFDYHLYMKSYQNKSKVMSGSYFQPPEKRARDWGSMPRWVAIVEFFLASRAKSAVISGANRRVGTTFAQLLASTAAARRMDEQGVDSSELSFYTSFQSSLLTEGLASQRGWGHTWRRFGGHLSCNNQTEQCARTPLLPYAWWDGPWQSPLPRDLRRMLAYGVKMSHTGVVEAGELEKTCKHRNTPVETLKLQLPSCKRLKLC